MDSQRSWIVAAGCCWINVFSYFMIRCAAVVFVNIIDTFHTTREEASWPVTLAATCFFSAGLIAGILVRHVPVWKITFPASIVAAGAVSSCYFATGSTYLALVYGVVHGLSVGHLTLASTVINQHFTKYRAVASGINMAGYSIGGLLFPSVTQFFFDEYGFRGALLLCGGTMLNAAAGTLLQRIPTPVQPETIGSQAAQSCGEEDVSGRATAGARELPESSDVPARLKDTHVTQLRNGCVRGALDGESNGSCVHNTHYRQHRDEGVIVQEVEPTAHEDGMVTATQLPALWYETSLASLKEAHPTHRTKRNVSSELEAVLSIQYAFHTEEPACNKKTLSCPAQYKPSTKDKITSFFEHRWSRCKGSRACTHVFIAQTARKKPPGSKSRLQDLKELFSFLAIPKYYSVLLSAIVILTNNAVYTTTIIDFALDCGIDRWRALTLITANTALDLTARFSTGWVTDRELISRSTLMAFCLTVWAATDFCFAFFRSYAVLVAVSAVAGWCNGSALPTLPVLCMEIMDIGHFSIAYGLCSFIAGLVGLAIPSLTGYFRDMLGNYSGLFLLLGACTAIPAVRFACTSLQENFWRCRRKQ